MIERHGERFLTRSSPTIERAKAERRKNRAETYAKRFAAKEACAKALGTGIRHGVWWRDMGVINLPSGPADHGVDRRGAKALDALTPKGHQAQIDITITDEGPMAVAFVVISAVPNAPKPAETCAGQAQTKAEAAPKAAALTAWASRHGVVRGASGAPPQKTS